MNLVGNNMNSPEELKEALAGNEDAYRFCTTFVSHCHVLDDIIDRDKPITDEQLIESEMQMMVVLVANPFFVENRTYLMPLIIQAFNAWLDSNKWEKSDDEKLQRASDVLKGYYHEVVYGAIYLCTGYGGLRKATSDNREYDFDFVKKTKGEGE